MKNELKAVLFDMDGLIFDTEVIHRQCWILAGQSFGYEINDIFFKHSTATTGKKTLILLNELFGKDCPAEAFYQQKKDFYQEYINSHPTQTKKGFVELFQWLRSQPLKLGLVTSSRSTSVNHHFASRSELASFNVVVTSEQVVNGKPDPEPYLLACQKLEVAPEETVVFEDSNNGIRSAFKAGCRTIMVPDYLPPEEDVQQHTYAILDSLSDARPLLTDQFLIEEP
ncbi:HAD family hydrolase [Endozoicomonas numazuensis]|uniref:HAD family hydrolase n=1 Tax=Endozoicomonas numazuensis TaxID=1137799 RepID=UPI000691D3AA|nr:HAD family phosphatase [Endozoicomonas numazuensis]